MIDLLYLEGIGRMKVGEPATWALNETRNAPMTR